MSATTLSPGALDAVHAGLAAALHDGTLALTDEVLGVPLLASVVGAAGIDVHDATVTSDADGVTLHGTADLLDAVGADITVRLPASDDRAVAATLHVELGGAPWGPDALALTDVSLDLVLSGSGEEARIDGTLRADSAHGPLALGVTIPVGTSGAWTLSAGISGDLLGLVPGLAGDALAALVGADAPVPSLGVLDRVDLALAFDPHARRVDALGLSLTVASWTLTDGVTVHDLVVRFQVRHPSGATQRSVAVTVDAVAAVAGLELPITVERAGTGAPWELRLAGGDGGGVALADVLAAFGAGDALSSLSPDLAALPSVALADLALTVEAGRSPALAALSCTVRADWEVVPGRFALHHGSASIAVDNPTEPRRVPCRARRRHRGDRHARLRGRSGAASRATLAAGRSTAASCRVRR